jgi:hypothetical protein
MKTTWRQISALLVLLSGHAAIAADALILGFHAHNPENITAAASTGYSAIRLWDTGTDWASLKPKRDQWNFERIDAYLATSQKANLKVLWTLGNTPRWASARPYEKCAYGYGCAAEPANIKDWRRYVRTVATTFRGQIECYELWNEASFPSDPAFKKPGAGGDPGQFFSGSVDAMVKLARVAYEEIKRADPQACVLSPSFHNSGHWAEKFDNFLAAGGGKYFDVVSQHFYYADEPEQAVTTIHAMQKIMAKHGLNDVPLWNTEVGVPFVAKDKKWTGMSLEDLVYAQTLRTYLLNASAGISRVYWYAWDNKEFGFFDPKTNLDIGSGAASAAVRLLDGIKSVSCQAKGNLWQCRVIASNRDFKVIWLTGKTTQSTKMAFDQATTRWGRVPEQFLAGEQIVLDGRPVIIADER